MSFIHIFQVANKQKIHIVSFQVPYPADYGGAIDVYYKAKALKQAGYYIALHTFAYNGRGYDKALLDIADEVFLYKRRSGFFKLLSTLPYIVKTRQSEELLSNLMKDDAPILFEGAHTTYFLSSPQLKERRKFVRTHNIESDYYKHLAKASHSIFKKIFFLSEHYKLSHYELQLKHADILFDITEKDKKALESICPGTAVELLPCFHNGTAENIQTDKTEKKDYILYNGNLSVEENIKAALFLIKEVAPFVKDKKWIIAGKNPSRYIIKAAAKTQNVTVIANPTHNEMEKLVSQAAINVLITFQATGIKLKLLNTLYHGGHCIVNDRMVEDSNLDSLCTVANNAQEIISAINRLMKEAITKEDMEKRKKVLQAMYDNNRNIQILSRHLQKA